MNRRRSSARPPRRLFRVVCAFALALALGGCATTPDATPIGQGSLIEAPSGDFTLLMRADGWSRFDPEPATGDERQVEISLARTDGGSSLQAFRLIDPDPSLDSYVADRRDTMLGSGAYDFREKRRFLGDESEITVSMARYRQDGTVILVVTAVRAPIVVELIGLTARGQGTERELLELMETVRIVEREATP